ncbi:MAG: chemotaxis protein MotB [Paraglaciecola sp.]|jgi:chemotaxis protein MotB
MSQTFNSAELVSETEKSEDQQGWLATFADLMSLLMCFFVLLLSFSELDAVKFKQIAGSMKTAFGVQNQIVHEQIPMGTSIIAQDFSAGIPTPTLLDEVKQITSETEMSNLAINPQSTDTKKQRSGRDKDATNHEIYAVQRRLEVLLEKHIAQGRFELDNQGQQLVIRISEKGTFASGSGFLQPQLIPTLEAIANILADMPGQVSVSGHTDNRALRNELFEDNLALSATRAIAVARVLKRNSSLKKIHIVGMADAQPLVDNNSSQNRAINRRVEISVLQGEAKTRVLPANLSRGE